MNKADLIDAITDTVGDKRTATAAVDAVLVVIQRTVAAGDKIAVPGFGVFEKADRAARTARNPATGAAVQLEATSVPRFRPGQRFREIVRGDVEVPELPSPAPLPSPRPARAVPATLAPPAADPVSGVAEPLPAPEPPPAKAAPAGPAAKAPAQVAPAKAPAKKAAVQAVPAKAPVKSAKKAEVRKAESKKAESKKADAKGSKKDAKAAAKVKDGKKSRKK